MILSSQARFSWKKPCPESARSSTPIKHDFNHRKPIENPNLPRDRGLARQLLSDESFVDRAATEWEDGWTKHPQIHPELRMPTPKLNFKKSIQWFPQKNLTGIAWKCEHHVTFERTWLHRKCVVPSSAMRPFGTWSLEDPMRRTVGWWGPVQSARQVVKLGWWLLEQPNDDQRPVTIFRRLED